MFYWYNSATQKIATPSPVQTSIFSANIKQLLQAESPKTAVCPTRSFVPMRTMASKVRMIPGTDIPYPPVDPKFKAKCEKFQAPNGLPVHLKGGPMDAIMLKATYVMIVIGCGMWFGWVAERYNKH